MSYANMERSVDMLFKKLHGVHEENDQEATVSIDDQKVIIEKSIRKQRNRYLVKRSLLTAFILLGAIAGFSGFLSKTQIIHPVNVVNDIAFAESYLQNYFTFPKSEEVKTFQNSFTLESKWEAIFDQNKVKSSSVIINQLYKTDVTNIDQLEFYMHGLQSITYSDGHVEALPVDTKITIAKHEDTYVVIKPIEMVQSTLSPLSDEQKKEFVSEIESANESCTDVEKAEIENTIKLFVTTYMSDYNQAKLLFKDPSMLYQLNNTSKLEFKQVAEASKDAETFYLSATIDVTTNTVLKQTKQFYFQIDIMSGKIINMEER